MVQGLWDYRLAGYIRWRLPMECPSEVPLASFPGWTLVTPLGYWRLGVEDPGFEQLGEIDDRDYFIASRNLVLRHDVYHTFEDMPLDELTEVSTAVIQRLRYISGQFNISRQIASITPMLLNDSHGDITVRDIRTSSMRNISIPNYAIPTAITLNDIEAMSALSTDPLHRYIRKSCLMRLRLIWKVITKNPYSIAL